MVLFYRCVDTLASEDGKNLREIEERMFHELVKQEVVDKMGNWEGSVSQNGLADKKIAAAVRASFKNYESAKETYDESFFQF